MSRVKNWHPVPKKTEDKLSSWNIRNLSIGGRLTLIKSVLGSLPLYFLSVFRAPAMVVKKLESLLLNFFWGNTGGGKKII